MQHTAIPARIVSRRRVDSTQTHDSEAQPAKGVKAIAARQALGVAMLPFDGLRRTHGRLTGGVNANAGLKLAGVNGSLGDGA